MRLLLDLCLPKPIKRHITGHECVHASEVPWGEAKNGRLLRAMSEEGFDALVTVDASMLHQNTLPPDAPPVVVLVVPSNRVEDILPSIPALLDILTVAPRGAFTVVPRFEAALGGEES